MMFSRQCGNSGTTQQKKNCGNVALLAGVTVGGEVDLVGDMSCFFC